MFNIEERAQEEGLMPKTILKEYLQVSILEYLYSVPESDAITFQGGTCLRLLYGGPRYSEDLDFVVTGFEDLPGIFKKVSSEVGKLSPLFGANLRMEVRKESESLARWKLYYEPADEDGNVSVSAEFAKYPAYTPQLLPLKLPKGYPAAPMILVKAETEQEILADKLNAAATRKYLKGRDIFDIWLLKSRGVAVDAGMVEKKFRDYSSPVVSIEDRIARFSVEQVRQDLENYLPRAYRERFQREGYGILLDAAREAGAEADRQMRKA